jgi:hypothetical protein
MDQHYFRRKAMWVWWKERQRTDAGTCVYRTTGRLREGEDESSNESKGSEMIEVDLLQHEGFGCSRSHTRGEWRTVFQRSAIEG